MRGPLRGVSLSPAWSRHALRHTTRHTPRSAQHPQHPQRHRLLQLCLQRPCGRWGRGVAGALALGLQLWSPGPPALAQQLAPAARQASAADPAAASDSGDPGAPYAGLEERPGDTARIRPGWHDFRRYGWGGISMCANAVTMLLGRLWRHQEQDTARFAARLQDSVPPAVGQLATRCGVDSLLPAALQQVARGEGELVFPAAYALAMLLHREADADALIRGALVDPHVPRMPLGRIEQVIWAQDTSSHPLRLSRLARDAALFDSLARRHAADTVLQQQALAAHVWLAEYRVRYWLQQDALDSLRPAAEALLAVCAQANPASLVAPEGPCKSGTTASALDVLLHVAILQHGARSPEVAAALQRYGHLTHENPAIWTARLTFLEKPFVWPLAPYWYSASGAALPPPVPSDGAALPLHAPVPQAKATLIWCPPPESDHRVFDAGQGRDLAKTLLLLQRLQARYGPQGLQLVILEHTRGFATGLGAVPPDREAAAIRQLYQEQGGLQALVVVDTVPYTISRDGRRTDSLSVWERRYALGWIPPLPPLLVDRQGRLRLYGSMVWQNGTEDPLLDLYIQHLLQEP